MPSIETQRTLLWTGIVLALGLPFLYLLLVLTMRSQCWHYGERQCRASVACTLDAEASQTPLDRDFSCRARNLWDAALQQPKGSS